MGTSIDVMLLCRNSIIREGLSRILSENGFSIVQSVSSAASLRPLSRTEHDARTLLLIDSGAEDFDEELAASLQRRFPAAYHVLLVDSFDLKAMIGAFRCGARAYIVKEISCDRLMGSLHLVAMGERVLPSQLADELQCRPSITAAATSEELSDMHSLSPREVEILRWLIMGCPNKVISRRMDISEATVKVHVKAVLRKLCVKNRTQAAIWAANHGMRGCGYNDERLPTAQPGRTVVPLAASSRPLVAA